MITTINPKIERAVVIVCLAGLALLMSGNIYAAGTFALGFAAAFPIAYNLWKVIANNWENLYKKMYSMSFRNRDMKIFARSWKKMWWLIPASFVIYAPISFGIMRFSQDATLLEACVLGSICATAWVSSQKSGRFYKEISGDR